MTLAGSTSRFTMPPDLRTAVRDAAQNPESFPDFARLAARGRRRRWTTRAAGSFVVIGSLAVGATALWPDRPPDMSVMSDEGTEDAPASVFEQLAQRGATASSDGRVYDSLLGAMPQVQYSVDGGPPVSLADGYVVGRVDRVEAGRSFRWPGIDSEGETETTFVLDFNADDAQISTVHVTMMIERSIVAPDLPQSRASALDAGNEVTFVLGLDSPADPSAIEAELKEAGTLAVLLNDSFVLDYDPSLWGVLEDGAVLGTVDGDFVQFPAAKGEGYGWRFKVADLEAPHSGEPIPLTFNEQTQTYHRVD